LRVFELSSAAGDELVDENSLKEIQKLLSVLDVDSAASAAEQKADFEEVIAASKEGGYVGLFAPFVSVSNFSGLKHFLEEAYAQKAKAMTSRGLEGPIISALKILHDDPERMSREQLGQFSKRMNEFMKVVVAICQQSWS
jgi:hypothetical protein